MSHNILSTKSKIWTGTSFTPISDLIGVKEVPIIVFQYREDPLVLSGYLEVSEPHIEQGNRYRIGDSELICGNNIRVLSETRNVIRLPDKISNIMSLKSITKVTHPQRDNYRVMTSVMSITPIDAIEESMSSVKVICKNIVGAKCIIIDGLFFLVV